MISLERKKQISDLADEVAFEFSALSQLDVEEVALANGITFNYGRYGTAFDGMLEFQNNRFHIYCNEQRDNKRNSPRGRFTFAHELGHYYIDQHRWALESGEVKSHPSKISYLSDHNPEVEQEANLFASCLLMPKFKLSKIIRKLPPGIETILAISELLNVSLTAAGMRYVASGATECILIHWKNGKIKWHAKADGLQEFSLRKDLDSVKDLKRDFASFKAIEGNTPPLGKKHFENGSSAEFWLRNQKLRKDSSLILIEQAVSIGKYGALSLLTVDKISLQ